MLRSRFSDFKSQVIMPGDDGTEFDMTIKKLIREICKREGLKKQVDISQITEVVGHIADIFYEEMTALGWDGDTGNRGWLDVELYRLGEKRSKRREKK